MRTTVSGPLDLSVPLALFSMTSPSLIPRRYVAIGVKLESPPPRQFVMNPRVSIHVESFDCCSAFGDSFEYLSTRTWATHWAGPRVHSRQPSHPTVHYLWATG